VVVRQQKHLEWTPSRIIRGALVTLAGIARRLRPVPD
jgi:hypothetical protein